VYQLVAYTPDGVRRFPVVRSRLVIGSQPDCDVPLPYTGVAQQHAEVLFDGERLRVADLGSRKGVQVSGRRVREAELEVLDEIRVGAVTLLVEDVHPDPAAEEPGPASAPAPTPAPPEPSAERMVDHLARFSEWVLADVESRTTLETMVRGVLDDFGGGLLLLLQGEPLAEAGIKLLVASDDSWLHRGDELVAQVAAQRAARPGAGGGDAFAGELAGGPAWICHHSYVAIERPYTLITALPGFGAEKWSPEAALRALGDLIILGLIHHVGWYEPILPGRKERPGLQLEEGVVVGESAAMAQAIELLGGAVDPPVPVLLRGEPGVGREALARSLHKSGRRRDGPFVVAGCGGAKPFQIEADLFGAEVPGRDGPVRREGKLRLADGGTLYLTDVEELPLDLQERLVRFLRSGQVEAAGSREAHPADVRIIAASRGPLEPAIAADRFRADLAYRLSRFAIDVPALRERREDLPLLIQSLVNRFCHETGKRMQGITVKAMSALVSYDYPGNLTELENIARHLVYRCPSGQPVDVSLLPEQVRLAAVQSGGRLDAASDLELDRLVVATERSAIREALKRSGGNKSQAARLLGLSRNGLAMKMERYGIEG
jgi:DNA-binding NtrC family response regulator